MKYQCPVCGFKNLPDKPENHEVCPCCGTQFGYDDYLTSHSALRSKWLAAGAKWLIPALMPQGWNAYRQLLAAHLISVTAQQTPSTERGLVLPTGGGKRVLQSNQVIAFEPSNAWMTTGRLRAYPKPGSLVIK